MKKISNENTYIADSREESAQKRIFRQRFTFKIKNMTRISSIILLFMMKKPDLKSGDIL